jgi:hypothetical protein
MSQASTRRRFIEIMPFVGVGFLAACSPKVETPAPSVSAPPPPPAPPVVAAPEPTPAPATPAPAAQTTTTAALPMLDEKVAQAVALGYVADSSRADKAKFAVWAAGRQCNGCALYLGKAGDAAGPCPLFAGKQVSAKGWCSSWVKKA